MSSRTTRSARARAKEAKRLEEQEERESNFFYTQPVVDEKAEKEAKRKRNAEERKRRQEARKKAQEPQKPREPSPEDYSFYMSRDRREAAEKRIERDRLEIEEEKRNGTYNGRLGLTKERILATEKRLLEEARLIEEQKRNGTYEQAQEIVRLRNEETEKRIAAKRKLIEDLQRKDAEEWEKRGIVKPIQPLIEDQSQEDDGLEALEDERMSPSDPIFIRVKARMAKELRERKEKEALEAGDPEKSAASYEDELKKLETARRIMRQHAVDHAVKNGLPVPTEEEQWEKYGYNGPPGYGDDAPPGPSYEEIFARCTVVRPLTVPDSDPIILDDDEPAASGAGPKAPMLYISKRRKRRNEAALLASQAKVPAPSDSEATAPAPSDSEAKVTAPSDPEAKTSASSESGTKLPEPEIATPADASAPVEIPQETPFTNQVTEEIKETPSDETPNTLPPSTNPAEEVPSESAEKVSVEEEKREEEKQKEEKPEEDTA